MIVRRKRYGLVLCLLPLLLIALFLSLPVRPGTGPVRYLGTPLARDNITNNNKDINNNDYNISDYNAINNYDISTDIWFYNVFNTADRNKGYRKLNSIANITTTTESLRNSHSTSGFAVRIRSHSHIVIIISYMRSGSTLTGDIMQHFPGTFYVFEPFHAMEIRTKQNKHLVYLNGTKRSLTNATFSDRMALQEELHKWLECRLEELDVNSLADSFHQYYSATMSKFSACWQAKHRIVRSLQECLPVAKELCERAHFRLFKFIRLPMDVIESVFESYPNLQVIHLLRDPRAVLRSQVKVNAFTLEEIPPKARAHCARISTDLSSTIRLYNKYPTRTRLLLYERLAENPLDTSRKMFTFIGKPHDVTILDYVYNMTQAGHRSVGLDFGVLQVNSTRTAYLWRDELSYHTIQRIDSYCKGVYSYLGYQVFRSERESRDHNFPTLLSPNISLIL
ncbi:carbohydrate sulfotransferase 5-like [Dreissena polymorpha]|uniref:Sulfotransferase domain-containing protein n=1 Tax=Dreissena polymorpha TaxID=45954 RepID=A0A9D4S547_DREPO|nr:carbohydrate sulfotransferase 5-like [Dreissena polymorpha]KAH3890833.1 hypothetical protein DPMN_014922 [Dreissena polymorpha]